MVLKKLKREERLKDAVYFLEDRKDLTLKELIYQYSNVYGVKKQCAIEELRKLEIEISKEMAKELLKKNKSKKKSKKKKEWIDDFTFDSDETFVFIAGYTEGGVPFGITYEEMEEQEKESQKQVYHFWDIDDRTKKRF